MHRELLVPAQLTSVHTIDLGEIRAIALTLPDTYEIEGKRYPIRDTIRPGNAFLARPTGMRTGKIRRRMYTRSNCALSGERVLETIINHTHEEKADTSVWWQCEQVETLHRTGGTIDVRVEMNSDGTALNISENSADCKPSNLRLEPDDQWPRMRTLAIALSTGITPFLAHLCHMRAHGFGRTAEQPGCRFFLIASVRHHRQLMEHEKLLELQREFPDNFRYYAVLTREWPTEWQYGKGRIIKTSGPVGKVVEVDLRPLLDLVPDIDQWHVRLCGGASARDQLMQGLLNRGIRLPSFRSEVW
jgi:hypothetical protein